MPISEHIDIKDFLSERQSIPVIDVRSPAEFAKGHIAEAFNIPLFTDDERAVVGTKYVKESRLSSVLAGLGFVGPRLRDIVERALQISPSKNVLLYCWRGGMRSASVAWLLGLAGFKVKILKGGYKSYRNYCQTFIQKPFNLIILGGMTGSGKTELLNNLIHLQEQVLDLEGLANHKGSAFGAIGQPAQPSTEQFENLIFETLLKIDPNKPIWVEDESKGIGSVFIPDSLYSQMINSPTFVIEIPFDLRVMRLVKEYTNCSPNLLLSAIDRITKKLGFDNTRLAKKAIENCDFKTAVEIVLYYYDKAYRYGVESKKNKPYLIRFISDNHTENALLLIQEASKLLAKSWQD